MLTPTAKPFGLKPRPAKVGKSQGTPTSPGTQKKVGKTRPQASIVSKDGDLGQGYSNAKRIGRSPAAKKHKEIVPRATISGRAKPKAEY